MSKYKCEHCEEEILYEIILFDVIHDTLRFCSSDCLDEYVKENTRLESI